MAGKALMKVINTSEGSVEKNYIRSNFVLEHWCFSVKNAQLFAKEAPQEEILASLSVLCFLFQGDTWLLQLPKLSIWMGFALWCQCL